MFVWKAGAKNWEQRSANASLKTFVRYRILQLENNTVSLVLLGSVSAVYYRIIIRPKHLHIVCNYLVHIERKSIEKKNIRKNQIETNFRF